ATSRRIGERQVRVALDAERPVPATGLRLAARQRHVEPGHLEDGEALADGVDPAETLDDGSQRVDVETEDLDVDVFRLAAHELVAHPTATDERAAASGSYGPGDIGGDRRQIHSDDSVAETRDDPIGRGWRGDGKQGQHVRRQAACAPSSGKIASIRAAACGLR